MSTENAATILPLFVRFPKEAEIIGRLLAGYGELEYGLCACLDEALESRTKAIRVLYRTRGEDNRVKIADALMRDKYEAIGLIAPYCEAMADLDFCRKIRNQYAHCHWTDGPFRDRLGFVEYEDGAKTSQPIELPIRHIDVATLIEQETYFRFVLDCLSYLGFEYRLRSGTLSSHSLKLPLKLARPPKNSHAT